MLSPRYIEGYKEMTAFQNNIPKFPGHYRRKQPTVAQFFGLLGQYAGGLPVYSDSDKVVELCENMAGHNTPKIFPATLKCAPK